MVKLVWSWKGLEEQQLFFNASSVGQSLFHVFLLCLSPNYFYRQIVSEFAGQFSERDCGASLSTFKVSLLKLSDGKHHGVRELGGQDGVTGAQLERDRRRERMHLQRTSHFSCNPLRRLDVSSPHR